MSYSIIPPDTRINQKIEIISGFDTTTMRSKEGYGDMVLWGSSEGPESIEYLTPMVSLANEVFPHDNGSATEYIESDESKVYKPHISTYVGWNGGTANLAVGDIVSLNLAVEEASGAKAGMRFVGVSFSDGGDEGTPSSASSESVALISGNFVLKVDRSYFLPSGTNVVYSISNSAKSTVTSTDPIVGLQVGVSAITQDSASTSDQALGSDIKFFSVLLGGTAEDFITIGHIMKTDDDYIYIKVIV